MADELAKEVAAGAQEQYTKTMRCGTQTYTGVLPRVVLGQIAFPVVQQVLRKRCYTTHAALQAALANATRSAVASLGGHDGFAKHFHFHCGVVADDFVALGVSTIKKEAVLPRTGSLKGLRALGEENATIQSLACREGRTERNMQTALCAYGKYCKMYKSGITRWYV